VAGAVFHQGSAEVARRVNSLPAPLRWAGRYSADSRGNEKQPRRSLGQALASRSHRIGIPGIAAKAQQQRSALRWATRACNADAHQAIAAGRFDLESLGRGKQPDLS
jgi:hypothetical protein